MLWKQAVPSSRHDSQICVGLGRESGVVHNVNDHDGRVAVRPLDLC